MQMKKYINVWLCAIYPQSIYF